MTTLFLYIIFEVNEPVLKLQFWNRLKPSCGEKMSFRGTIIIKREEEWFVATCLENNIASQGKTI
ncbi:MAG: hypothetical protein LBD08_04875, partial [Treponema sp.]|nr:hypothetical protein [Treponema sp.]